MPSSRSRTVRRSTTPATIIIRRRYGSSSPNSGRTQFGCAVAILVPHIHFESRHDRPRVFKITGALIAAARKRNKVPARIKSTLGNDLDDLSPLATAIAFVSSNDVVTDPR